MPIWLVAIGGLALGASATWNGARTWQGRELSSVTRMLTEPTPRVPWAGGRTMFATWYGAGGAGLAIGPAFLLLAVGGALGGRSENDAAWWMASSLTAVALLALGGLYLLAYQWFDLPDSLRPAAQRGQPRPGETGPGGQHHPVDQVVAAIRQGRSLDLGEDPTHPTWTGTPQPTEATHPTDAGADGRRRAIWRALTEPPPRR